MAKVLYQGKVIETDAEKIDGKEIIASQADLDSHIDDAEMDSYYQLQREMGIGADAYQLPDPFNNKGMATIEDDYGEESFP